LIAAVDLLHGVKKAADLATPEKPAAASTTDAKDPAVQPAVPAPAPAVPAAPSDPAKPN
jgi:hypothetical protein